MPAAPFSGQMAGMRFLPGKRRNRHAGLPAGWQRAQRRAGTWIFLETDRRFKESAEAGYQ
jgi:hypothetical protein